MNTFSTMKPVRNSWTAVIAVGLAPNLILMLVARILVGFCIGGIWAIAGGLASRLVQENAIGLATSIIFGGVAAASVLGVPLGAFIGDVFGWRWAFGIMTIFSALVLVFHLAVIPALPVTGSTKISQFIDQLGYRKIRAGLFLTLLLVTSHFVAFYLCAPATDLSVRIRDAVDRCHLVGLRCRRYY